MKIEQLGNILGKHTQSPMYNPKWRNNKAGATIHKGQTLTLPQQVRRAFIRPWWRSVGSLKLPSKLTIVYSMCTGKVHRGHQSYTFNQHNLPLRRY